ncbi:hypothetical protein GQ457_02G020690 [Hibiscus cannabinus]
MVWTDVCENLTWNLGNGRNVDFWHDSWITVIGPLAVHIGTLNQAALPRVSIAAMLTTQGTWNWPLFQHLLPSPVLLRIAAVKEPDPLFPEDAVGWGLTTNHNYTIKSTYELRFGSIIVDPDRSGLVVILPPIDDALCAIKKMRMLITFFSIALNWDLMFADVLWNLWLHRNAGVFSSEAEQWGSIVVRSKWLANSTAVASQNSGPLAPRSLLVSPAMTLW